MFNRTARLPGQSRIQDPSPASTGATGTAVIQRCGAHPCSCSRAERAQHLLSGPANASGRQDLSRIPAWASQPAASTASALATLAESGEALPAAARARFEPSFGADFSDVRLHTSSLAAQAADELDAEAWTSGAHVVMGAGRYRPGIPASDRLLAHELTHVVQQRAGQMAPTDGHGENPHAEAQAEGVAARVTAGGRSGPVTATPVQIARSPRGKSDVTRIDFDTARMKMSFNGRHAHSWTLNDADLESGDYLATIHRQEIPISKVIITLMEPHAGIHFSYTYGIYPGEPDPMDLVDEGQTVRVHVTAAPKRAAQPTSAGSGQNQVTFRVAVVDADVFEAATGRPASGLPEGSLVDASSYSFSNPGWGLGLGQTPYPFPGTTTGVAWAAGHMVDVAAVQGAVTARGFRAGFGLHARSFAERKWGWFGGRAGEATAMLNRGVPGSYAQDYWYLYSPDARLIHRGRLDVSTAQQGADTINAAVSKYEGAEYRFSPPQPGTPEFAKLSGGDPAFICPAGQNCITEGEHTAMLGDERMTVNPADPVDIATGRSLATGEEVVFLDPKGLPYSGPGYARNATRWASGTQGLPKGLTSTPLFPGMVVRGVLRTGGKVFVIYGVYESLKRIARAPGDELPAVIIQEGGSWLGGWAGATLSSATLGTVVCSEIGPAAVICGAVFGIVGGVVGAVFGRNLAEDLTENLSGIGDLLRNPAKLSETSVLMVGTPEEQRIYFEWKRFEQEEAGESDPFP